MTFCPNNKIIAGVLLFRIARYLKYILLSKHRKGHGIHSPFVFDLVSRVFRNKIDDDIVFRVEQVRKRLVSDQSSIKVNDLGSGAASTKTNIRKVSEIARNSSVSLKYGVLLSNMAAEFGGELIVEFGTAFGISTMYMAASCPDARVNTIEGCTETSEIALMNFSEAGFSNISLFNRSFDDALDDVIVPGNSPGMVFIDGNHRKEPVLRYFSKLAEISDSNTVIIIDDINYSKEMSEAWDEIRRFEKVSVTVDICRMGIVFFRKGINRNNYIVRY